MNSDEAVRRINSAVQRKRDPDKLHATLDDILLECVPKAVAKAYGDAVDAAEWWAHG